MKKNGKTGKRYRRKNKRGGRKSKKNSYSSATTLVMREPTSLVPDRLKVPMQWSDNYQMSVAAASGGVAAQFQYAWRLNSVYDPDQPVGPSQKSAYGFNTLKLLYTNYRVFGSKIRVDFINQSSAQFSEAQIAIYPADTLITVTSDPDVKASAEKPYAKRIVLATTSGQNKGHISHYMTCKKLVGQTSIEYDIIFAGTGSLDPAQVFFWNMGIDNFKQPAGPGCTVLVQAKITYYTEWFNRTSLAP